MAFILNQYQIDDAQREAAEDFHRPNAQAAVLTLARLVEWTNNNSDGWAYWSKPSNASKKLQSLVKRAYGYGSDPDTDLTAREVKDAYATIKGFLTRNGTDHREVFLND